MSETLGHTCQPPGLDIVSHLIVILSQILTQTWFHMFLDRFFALFSMETLWERSEHFLRSYSLFSRPEPTNWIGWEIFWVQWRQNLVLLVEGFLSVQLSGQTAHWLPSYSLFSRYSTSVDTIWARCCTKWTPNLVLLHKGFQSVQLSSHLAQWLASYSLLSR